MKKNMIALAVAGALVAPVAMADVNISGGLQAELVQVGGNGTQPNGLYANDAMEMGAPNSGNYGFLKFSAAEDLGGGMKALAVYNMNTNVGNTGTAGFGTRDAYVGLSSGFGTVLAGTLATPYKSSTVGWDPMLATSFQARGNGGMSFLQNGYVSNAVAYANSFAGGMVNLVAAVVLDETQKNDAGGIPTDKTVGKHAKSFSLNIKPMSGLDVAIAYIDVTNFGNAYIASGVDAKDQNATKVGVKYGMGAFSVAYQHEFINKGLTATGEKGGVDYVTASFKMDDANTVSASYGKSSKKVGAISNLDYANATVDVATGSKDTSYAAIDFNHAFSKNTSAYVGYRVSDAGTVTSGTLDMTTGTVGATTTANSKESAFGAGLRVNF